MTSTLRSRLWLSYAVILLAALFVVAVGLVIALQRSPVLYRQVIQRLNLAGAVASQRIDDLPRLSAERQDQLLSREGETRQVRFIVLSSEGAVLNDVGPGSGTQLPKFSSPAALLNQDSSLANIFRDPKGTDWLYTVNSLDNQHFLISAAPRPNLPLRSIFRDDVLGPFLQAALVAGVLAIVLGLIIGQWISNPLKRMANSARRMETGNYEPIPLEGPREVQQLGEALNEMAHRVQNSQQSQRNFVANVSHELKTPLTSIQGFSQAILDGTAQTPEQLNQAASVIYSEAGRMNHLVLDLLSLARLEAGTADLQRTPVDLNGLLKGIVDKFSIQARQVKINLCSDLPQLPPVVGDGDRLAQVFNNLLDNALKFTPAGGTVSVGMAPAEGAVLVKVSDSGVGIASEELPRIFERFYQADKSRKGGAGRGVGLGLAIAAQIVTAHGGRIWVESQVGHGSVFTVSLPNVPPVYTAPEARRKPA